MRYLKIVAAAIVLVVIGTCSVIKPTTSEIGFSNTESVVDTVYVNVSDASINYTPTTVKEYVTVNDTIVVTKKEFVEIYRELTDSDKEEIVEDYFTKRHYVDSLETEYGYVTVDDQIWKNEIYSRKYSYDFTIPHIKTTNTVEYEPNRFNLFVGLDANIFLNNIEHGFSENSSLSPKAYVGAKYRIGDYHNVKVEYDFFNNGLGVGYAYNKDRWEFESEYFSRWNLIQIESRFYLIK